LPIWRCARRAKNDGGAETLRELVRTNDAVLISAIEALLKSAGIPHLLADQNISVLEGSIGAFQRRILVGEDEIDAARELLAEAGYGDELRPDVS
jgi:Putative prokaryotic signal transducing protein